MIFCVPLVKYFEIKQLTSYNVRIVEAKACYVSFPLKKMFTHFHKDDIKSGNKAKIVFLIFQRGLDVFDPF